MAANKVSQGDKEEVEVGVEEDIRRDPAVGTGAIEGERKGMDVASKLGVCFSCLFVLSVCPFICLSFCPSICPSFRASVCALLEMKSGMKSGIVWRRMGWRRRKN